MLRVKIKEFFLLWGSKTNDDYGGLIDVNIVKWKINLQGVGWRIKQNKTQIIMPMTMVFFPGVTTPVTQPFFNTEEQFTWDIIDGCTNYINSKKNEIMNTKARFNNHGAYLKYVAKAKEKLKVHWYDACRYERFYAHNHQDVKKGHTWKPKDPAL
jgi:hypothetical protein